MFKTAVVFTSLLCVLSWSLTAQVCHTKDLSAIETRLAQNQATAYSGQARTRAVQYVPVAMHATRNDDGMDGISEAQILDMMCILNDKYEDQEIQFYLTSPPIHYIFNSGINNAPGQFISQLRDARVPDAINVFVTNNINNQVGAAGFYQSPAGWDGNDFIVIARGFVYAQNVFPHEIGHFFSLLHPFHGWENNPWDENNWGNPVAANAPSDPGIFPQPVPNEFQNGSNCTTAGDRICDTPPDYLFALHPNQNACNNWPLSVRDPNNTIVNPQENNVMSYFNNCGDYIFTQGQKTAIQNDLFNSPDRAYVRLNYTPDMTAINSVPMLLSPEEGSTTNSSENVSFSWFPVFEAQYYVIEVDLSPGFSSPFRKSTVVGASTPSANFTDLEADTDYFWRVRPFTEYTTCTGYSDRGSFRTATSVSVEELTTITASSISPNPVKAGTDLHWQLDLTAPLSGTLRVYNINGQLSLESNVMWSNGTQIKSIPTTGLMSGVYIIVLESENKRKMERVVIE